MRHIKRRSLFFGPLLSKVPEVKPASDHEFPVAQDLRFDAVLSVKPRAAIYH